MASAAAGRAGEQAVWVETRDAASGRTFYFNPSTKARVWRRPKNALVRSLVPSTAPAGPHAARAAADPELGDDWVRCMDPERGQPFFYNRRTGKRVWRLPRSHRSTKHEAAEAAHGEDSVDAASSALASSVAAAVASAAMPSSPPSGDPAGHQRAAAQLHLRRDHSSISRSLYGVSGTFSAFTPEAMAMLSSIPAGHGSGSDGDDGDDDDDGGGSHGTGSGSDGGDHAADGGDVVDLSAEPWRQRGVVVMFDDQNAITIVPDTERASPGSPSAAPLTEFHDSWQCLSPADGRNVPSPPLVSVGNPSSSRTSSPALPPLPPAAAGPVPPTLPLLPSAAEPVVTVPAAGEGGGPPLPRPVVTARPPPGTPMPVRLLSVDGQWERIVHASLPRPFYRHVSGTTSWVCPDGAEFVKSSGTWRSLHPISPKSPSQSAAAQAFLNKAFGQWPPRSIAPALSKATEMRRPPVPSQSTAPPSPASPPLSRRTSVRHRSSAHSPSSTASAPPATRSPAKSRQSDAASTAARRAPSVAGGMDMGAGSTGLPHYVAMRIASELQQRSADLADLQHNPTLYNTVMREQGKLGRVKGSGSSVFPDKHPSPTRSAARDAAVSNASAAAAAVLRHTKVTARQRRATLAAYLQARPVFHVESEDAGGGGGDGDGGDGDGDGGGDDGGGGSAGGE